MQENPLRRPVNFPAWRLARAVTLAEISRALPIAAAQFEHSLVHREPEADLFRLLTRLALASSPGHLWGVACSPANTAKGGGRAEGFGGKVFQPENSAQRTRILDTVLEVAGELGVSAGQVAIAWAGSHGAVPIVGPRSHEQIADNLGALSLTLTDEQIQRLDAVSSLDPSAGPRSAADWSDETRARGVA